MPLQHHRWLAAQLPAWEREGILTPEGARKLREQCATEPTGGLAHVIVGAVGALLIGTGVIAVLAYNWHDFPRGVRLLVALGPLAASQAASWWVLRQQAAAAAWHREAAALLQTFAAGAALALVSQIYNLPGRWTDLVFWWCVVSLPLAWVLESQAVAIAYLLGIAVWAVGQAGEGARWSAAADVADLRVWFPLLLAGVLPVWPGLGLRDRPGAGSRLVLAASALIGLLAVAVDAAARPTGPIVAVPWLALLSAAAVLLFPLDRAGIDEPLTGKPQVLLGGGGIVLMALAATYEYPARQFAESVRPALGLGWCWVLLAVVIAFGAIAVRQGRFAVIAVAGLALVPPLAAPLASAEAGGWPVAIAYSALLVVSAIALIALEFFGRRGAARIGAALITMLVILRMADADVSLLIKGLVFIVIGSAFLAFNALVTRRRTAAAGGSLP